MLSGEEGGNIGIGFAVPINTAKALLPQLRKGKVVRGRIGLRVSPISEDEAQALELAKPEGAIVRQVEGDSPAERADIKPGDVRGAVVEDVEPGSAAEAAGLRPNDVILDVNHRAVRNAADAARALRQAPDAQVVFLLISRGGMQMFVSMRQR